MSRALSILPILSHLLSYSGIEEPEREAEELLRSALSVDRLTLYRDNPFARRDQLRVLCKSIKVRMRRFPLQYITGAVHFFDLKILTPNGVFIPRPETELLVEEALGIASTIDSPKVLDIGTGTGCIAIAFAKNRPDASVYATDISKKAIETARENAFLNNVTNLEFIQTDTFPPGEKSFDLILSNPPYIRTQDIASLQPEVCRYEPEEALDGGKDGLRMYRKIIQRAKGHLKEGGYLIIEVGIGQAEDVISLGKQWGFTAIKTTKDLSGIDRVVVLQWKNY